MLHLDGVTRHFDRRTILRDIDLHVEHGERVALTGANGAGKTTLLRIAAGILRPHAGTVAVAGESGQAARRHFAYVAHDAPVYRELTPADHLRFAAAARGRPLPSHDIIHHLRDAGLDTVADRPAATLSRGQRQRLALAMAWSSHASLLLLDEPTTALDAGGQEWFNASLERTDAAVVIASHDAAALGADRTLTLEGGRLQ